jgi:hypothetical protein
MATNMDRGLYAAPQGLEDLAQETPEIEIEIVPDGMELEVEVETIDPEFYANLAEEVTSNALATLASQLESDIDNDRMSRKDWEQAYIDGLKLLGLKYEERNEPWTGACGVFHPMITEAVVRFQSETITETFPASGPVRTKILGKETPEKKAAADRVQADMNYQLTERMVEFRPEHERLLWNLPAAGSAFKKVYFDPSLNRQASLFIPAEDILLPYGVSDARSSHRITHVMRKTKNDIIKLQQAGFYIDCDLGEPDRTRDDISKAKDEETGFSDVNDDRFVLYECHVDLDLPGFEDVDADGEPTGIMLPYVVTLVRGTGTILSIRRNWKESDPLCLKRQHFVQYNYIPGFGPYGFGLFHLIGGFAKSATSIMRQLVDAGTLANLPGGLKSRGLRIKGDDTPISPGEFRDVDLASGNIRDNILPLPYKEPSQTLFTLLGSIVEEGRRFAATADMKVSDMSAQAPVGTTLALLERQLKVMTAVQARVHYALKQELNLIKGVISDFAENDYDYQPDTGTKYDRNADFEMVEVIPVSDPNASTLSQRVVQYQAVIQLAQSAPQIYNLPQLHRGMLEVLGIKHADKLVPMPEDMKPLNPVTENMNILKGKPVKAFVYQDHAAHLAVHQAAMQDPSLMQVIGQNPQAQAIMAAAQAHLAEHAAFQYLQKMEGALGLPLPADDEDPLPPDHEKMLSGMLAQASQQVLQMSQQQAAQQAAQQQAQDPVIQLQQREMALKERQMSLQEQQLKIEAADKADKQALAEKKVQIDAADRADKQALAERKQMATEELNEQNIQVKTMQTGALSRAQDSNIAMQDREMALKELELLQNLHAQNQLGASGGEQ